MCFLTSPSPRRARQTLENAITLYGEMSNKTSNKDATSLSFGSNFRRSTILLSNARGKRRRSFSRDKSKLVVAEGYGVHAVPQLKQVG